jgi:hypothetical protein
MFLRHGFLIETKISWLKGIIPSLSFNDITQKQMNTPDMARVAVFNFDR